MLIKLLEKLLSMQKVKECYLLWRQETVIKQAQAIAMTKNDGTTVYPASYDFDSIVSVAALDVEDNLGKFSNFGQKTVDIGAPGVDVFSTVVTLEDQRYNNVVLDLSMIGMEKITWNGTSMSTPHVAGAAALWWSQNPKADFRDVKKALLDSAVKISSLSGKVVSEGKLNVTSLMKIKKEKKKDRKKRKNKKETLAFTN